jgi:hypothetical protein
MSSVLVRIVNFTDRWTPGYCIEPPKPPNAGMQKAPALVLSLTLIPPYLLFVCWPMQAGGPVTAGANVTGAGIVPLG